METTIIFVLWLIFWSFGSVLITRLPNQWSKNNIKWVLVWRSQCPNCKKELKRYNLIPLFSYLFQWWKCSKCKNKISILYPVLELCSWLIFLATFILFPYNNIRELGLWIFINWWLLLLIFYDILKYELNINIQIWLAVVTTMYLVPFYGINALLGSLALWLVFLWIYYFSKWYVKKRWFKDLDEWIGFGDVILASYLGLFISIIFIKFNIEFTVFHITQFALIFLILSCTLWLLYFAIEKLFTKNRQSIIPFLPSMIISFWLLVLYYDEILKITLF